MALPVAIYSSAQVRALDRRAIERQGIASYELMKRAGEASLRALRMRWPTAQRIAVVCGGGNNGGDGYVLARFAQAAGLSAAVIAATDPSALSGDAARAHQDWRATGAGVRAFDGVVPGDCDVVVDALTGTGLKDPLRPAALAVVAAINGAGPPVLALDVPSGLDSDSGLPLGGAVRAAATITFVGLKTGLFLGDGPEFVGQLFFDDLGVEVPSDDAAFVPPLERLLDEEIGAVLRKRARTAHKGEHGRVLIVGGGVGMAGAAQLAGHAALRAGAGLVQIACAPPSAASIVAAVPELLVRGIDSARELAPLVERADVVAVGPGLGQDDWARAVWQGLQQQALGKPWIVDADALNLLANERAEPQGRTPTRDWILTPHPGEAARLLGRSVREVQSSRLASVTALVERFGATVVLKGAGSLVAAPGRVPAICSYGNPGMATAGMGDVLTGVIAAIRAQGVAALPAARAG
ncbi:MAG: NAD(P)H-hydrate dehydratase, partial [Steroidobacteraceae bacterium]|nr:NAD(P)H-hydrate dehydratase [Steroidobacteraceae bacterium]